LVPIDKRREIWVSGFWSKVISAAFRRGSRGEQILRSFQAQRQELQRQFFELAAASGKPRGLQWLSCEWLDTFAIVHDPDSGMLTLFVGVNVSFTAVAGGDMEGLAAVGMIRDGAALFHQQKGRWGSGGRVLFNMTPEMAANTTASAQHVLLCVPSDGASAG
jgi:hypothetical protein